MHSRGGIEKMAGKEGSAAGASQGKASERGEGVGMSGRGTPGREPPPVRQSWELPGAAAVKSSKQLQIPKPRRGSCGL